MRREMDVEKELEKVAEALELAGKSLSLCRKTDQHLFNLINNLAVRIDNLQAQIQVITEVMVIKGQDEDDS